MTAARGLVTALSVIFQLSHAVQGKRDYNHDLQSCLFTYRVTKCFSDIFLHIISTLFKFQPLLSYIKDLYSLDLNVFLESDHMGHLNHDNGNVAY